jgi:hypothetical protein
MIQGAKSPLKIGRMVQTRRPLALEVRKIVEFVSRHLQASLYVVPNLEFGVIVREAKVGWCHRLVSTYRNVQAEQKNEPVLSFHGILTPCSTVSPLRAVKRVARPFSRMKVTV